MLNSRGAWKKSKIIILPILILTLLTPTLVTMQPVSAQTMVSGGFWPTGGSTGPAYDPNNYYGYAFLLPYSKIDENPYRGFTGNFNLLSDVAITYGQISVVVWIYQPPHGEGVILSLQDERLPHAPGGAPLIYVGTDGILYVCEWVGSNSIVSTTIINTTKPLTPGWHMIVLEEQALSTSSFVITVYVDGIKMGSISSNNIPTLMFGLYGTYPYAYVGTGYMGYSNNGNGAWFFYNGTIALLAVYNYALPPSVVEAMWRNSDANGNVLNAYLPSKGLVIDYQFSPSYFNSTSSSLLPAYQNSTILSQLGFSEGTASSLQLVSYGSQLENNIWGSFVINSNYARQNITSAQTTTTPSVSTLSQSTTTPSSSPNVVPSTSFLNLYTLIIIVLVVVIVVLALLLVVRRK